MFGIDTGKVVGVCPRYVGQLLPFDNPSDGGWTAGGVGFEPTIALGGTSPFRYSLITATTVPTNLQFIHYSSIAQAGKKYKFSGMVQGVGSGIGKIVAPGFYDLTATTRTITTLTLTANWQRFDLYCTPANISNVYLNIGNGGVGDTSNFTTGDQLNVGGLRLSVSS